LARRDRRGEWPDLPEADQKALAGLKFSEALPPDLAVAILAERLADLDHARAVLGESASTYWRPRPGQ
jgi:hypothetical protein